MDFNPGSKQLQFCNSTGNRIWHCEDHRAGNTTVGAFAVACHLTKDYPKWWKGIRLEGPVHIAVLSETLSTFRDFAQKRLLSFAAPSQVFYRQGIKDCISHAFYEDGSCVNFFSSEFERERFMGCVFDYLWIDNCPTDRSHPLMVRSNIISYTGSPI